MIDGAISVHQGTPELVVYKYELKTPVSPGKPQTLLMPGGSTILKVGGQGIGDDLKLFVWALVRPEPSYEEVRKWIVAPTGTRFPYGSLRLLEKHGQTPADDHVVRHPPTPYDIQESVVCNEGRFVFHVWISHPRTV